MLNIVCMLATALSVALFFLGVSSCIAPAIPITEDLQLPSVLHDWAAHMTVIGFLGMVIIRGICRRFFR